MAKPEKEDFTCSPEYEPTAPHEAVQAFVDRLCDDDTVPPTVRALAATAAQYAHCMMQPLTEEAAVEYYGQSALARKEAFEVLEDCLATRFLAEARKLRAGRSVERRPVLVRGPDGVQ